MFKINRKIEYALIALKYMSQKGSGKLVSAKEICDLYHTPFDTTSRALQLMTQQRILKAEHGAQGGYQIVGNLSKISFFEIVEIILGPVSLADCFQPKHAQCELTGCCNIIGPFLYLNEKLVQFLKSISVQELLDSKHPNERMIREQANILVTPKNSKDEEGNGRRFRQDSISKR